MTPSNCIIIHGCPSTADDLTYASHWIPWVKNRLAAADVPTEVPLMPTPWNPRYTEFKKEFDRVISLVYQKNDLVLVGHSCGASFLVRWLGETKKKVSKLILVAPWRVDTAGDVGRDEFYGFDIDPTIRDRVGEITYFTSDNEEQEGKESLRIFYDVLGGEVIDLPGHGHYTFDDMGTEQFPELVKEIVEKNI